MEITILYEDTHTGKRPEWMALECNELLASSEGLKIMNIGGLEMEAEYTWKNSIRLVSSPRCSV